MLYYYPFLCLAYTIIIFVLVVSIITYISEYKKRKSFEQIASKKDGKVVGIVSPKREFLHKGCKLNIKSRPERKGRSQTRSSTPGSRYPSGSSSYNPPKTEIIVKLRNRVDKKMIIKEKNLAHKIAIKLGKKYTETGDKSFDNHYVIKGDKNFSLEILNKNVIDKLSSGYLKIIKLKGNILYLKKEAYSKTEMFYKFQIKKATSIVDRLVELGYI